MLLTGSVSLRRAIKCLQKCQASSDVSINMGDEQTPGTQPCPQWGASLGWHPGPYLTLDRNAGLKRNENSPPRFPPWPSTAAPDALDPGPWAESTGFCSCVLPGTTATSTLIQVTQR